MYCRTSAPPPAVAAAVYTAMVVGRIPWLSLFVTSREAHNVDIRSDAVADNGEGGIAADVDTFANSACSLAFPNDSCPSEKSCSCLLLLPIP